MSTDGAEPAHRGAARPESVLRLVILGLQVQVACNDASLARLAKANYGAFAHRGGTGPPELQYRLDRGAAPDAFKLTCRGQTEVAADLGELLFLLEKDMTVVLQQRRPDLLFLHAAALEHGGKAFVLAGESGNGKSTTAWGLLHHGLRYLSDELSPIAVDTLQVWAYPHALCLKQRPPAAYPLPAAGVLDLGRTLHVPVRRLPSAKAAEPCELGAVIFVRYRPELRAPELRAIGPAEAAARMYVTTLNALAHADHGLDAVVRITERVPCFALDGADLRLTCDRLVRLAAAPARAHRRLSRMQSTGALAG